MLSFHQKRLVRAVSASRWTQAILLMAIIFMATSAYGRYVVARDMAERRVAAEKVARELAERKERLAEEVHYITSERGIEAEMRRQFDVAREGERVVIILDEPPADE